MAKMRAVREVLAPHTQARALEDADLEQCQRFVSTWLEETFVGRCEAVLLAALVRAVAAGDLVKRSHRSATVTPFAS